MKTMYYIVRHQYWKYLGLKINFEGNNSEQFIVPLVV